MFSNVILSGICTGEKKKKKKKKKKKINNSRGRWVFIFIVFSSFSVVCYWIINITV
jgi:hypothetical protein